MKIDLLVAGCFGGLAYGLARYSLDRLTAISTNRWRKSHKTLCVVPLIALVGAFTGMYLPGLFIGTVFNANIPPASVAFVIGAAGLKIMIMLEDSVSTMLRLQSLRKDPPDQGGELRYGGTQFKGG